jgi:hypothetical protein
MSIDKSNWAKCSHCKDMIPPGLGLSQICLDCLTGRYLTPNKGKDGKENKIQRG